jgi:superfamily II DNA or RNA helicase
MVVRVVVDNRVRLLGELPEDVGAALRARFTHRNPKRDALRRMGIPGWWAEPEEIATWEASAGELSLPRGGMSRVRAALREGNVEFKVVDERCAGDPEMQGHGLALREGLELWAHQEHALREAIAKQNCIVRAPTGSGKTLLAMALVAEVQLPTLVIVHNVELLEQWVKRAGDLGVAEREIGIVRGKVRRLRPLTVAMQRTLAQHGVDEELAGAFGAVIVDECHLSPAATFFAAIDPFPARYRIGVSADHRRKDGKEFLAADLFGEVAADIKLEEVEAAGHVLDVEVRVVATEFRADWYGMPEGGDEERELDFGRLLEEMAADADRNARAVSVVLDEVAAGERVLVMAHRREHCRQLAAQLVAHGCPAGFLIGGDDYRKEFEATRDAMISGKLRVGVGTFQSVGTGIDLPSVGRVVAVTPLASNRQLFGQVRGRACRAAKGTGKRDARLYYLLDPVFGRRHLKNLMRWNRSVVVRGESGAWREAREWLDESSWG